MNQTKFKSFYEALTVVTDRKMADKPVWREAYAYCLEHAPSDLKKQIDEIQRSLFEEFFPDIKPKYCDDQGNAFFDGEEIRKALGMSKAEYDKSVADLVEVQGAVGTVCRQPADKLHRIQ